MFDITFPGTNNMNDIQENTKQNKNKKTPQAYTCMENQ